MQIQRSSRELVVQAPAKLNLFFEVLAKRNDGYHEIETLMCPINLYDTLHFREESDGAVHLRCRRVAGADGPAGRGLDHMPDGPENLVMRAIELVRRRAGIRRGARLLLVKRIPAAAGLGGGSSDAAAALAAANYAWRLGRSRGELAQWAAELGSDVPFFFANGPAICRGRGERITPIPVFGTIHFVVVRPPAGLPTAAVYGSCRPAEEPRSAEPLSEALHRGDWPRAGRQIWNRLQVAAAELSPWPARMEREFVLLDCLGHGMSGSGTSYFGICRHARHARRTARCLQAKGFNAVFVVRSCR
jgi:4-diphosphocytidyl-2-C-methyl-D-erythritol kinase